MHRHHALMWGMAAAAAFIPGLALAVPLVTSADVTLIDPVNGTFGPQTVAAGGAIFGGDGSTLGNILLNDAPFGPTEIIDVGTTTLTYDVIGGAPCTTPLAGFSCAGYTAGAVYTFDLSFSDPGDFVQSLSVTPVDTQYASGFGVTLDPTGTIVTMDVGESQLYVQNSSGGGVVDFGAVEVSLTISGPIVGTVPEPATGALLGLGLAVAGFLRRRRRG